MTIDEILKDSPDIPAYGGGQWAIYGARCCWWTSFPGTTGKRESGLPVCPHCGSPLLQAPLQRFVALAQANPDAYGAGGIAAFVAAHAFNSDFCAQNFDAYARAISLERRRLPNPLPSQY
ncbi:MAG: hypothetical protein WBO46_23940, partial [Caldilineaceae bacterium]